MANSESKKFKSESFQREKKLIDDSSELDQLVKKENWSFTKFQIPPRR